MNHAEISRDAIWSLAESPYWLSDAVEVRTGGSLTIEPGVSILVSSGAGGARLRR